MCFNNVLTAICFLLFFSLLAIAFAAGHNQRVIESRENDSCSYDVLVLRGTDTVAYDHMTYADLEYLERTGSLR